MHLKRLVVAAIFVPLLYLSIMHLPPEYFLFMLAFVSTVGLYEFYDISKVRGLLKYSGLLWGGALLAAWYINPGLFPVVMLLAALASMGLRLFLRRDATNSVSEVSAAVFGLLYIPGLLSFQLSLVKTGPEWIVLLYAAVWASDSMAYYVGKGIGKRKLYPEISPNKTVAGAFGSLLGGVLGTALIKAALLPAISVTQILLIGLAVGGSTIIGDLAESMFKRDAGVKDSGSLIPGHGGILDKIDGVTFAGPVFYWVCKGLGLVW